MSGIGNENTVISRRRPLVNSPPLGATLQGSSGISARTAGHRSGRGALRKFPGAGHEAWITMNMHGFAKSCICKVVLGNFLIGHLTASPFGVSQTAEQNFLEHYGLCHLPLCSRFHIS